MTREDLIYIKNALQEEIKKREKLKELLNNPNVQDYITLTSGKTDNLVKDDYDLLKSILEKYNIPEERTNGIYVCVDTTERISRYSNAWQMTVYDKISCPKIDTSYFWDRNYWNVESGLTSYAFMVDIFNREERIADYFERKNIVLNPYNKKGNNWNGYEEVKRMFWENTLKYGQEESIKLLLKKYPRL